jgi:hypothetical protein
MTTTPQQRKILASYERYDADPRVNGPDDYDAYEEALIASPHHRLTLVSLLTCMAIAGGPEDCCGCFKGHWCDWDGGFYSFECNECGRQAFVAHEDVTERTATS